MGVTISIYCVLTPVRISLSVLGAFFGLAGVAIGGASWVIHLAPLLLLHGDQYLTAFTTSQLQALSLAALTLPMQVFPIGMVFFGIQCISIGYLITRSTFLPPIFAVLLAISEPVYLIAPLSSFLPPFF